MGRKFLKQSLFSRVMVLVVVANFILTCAPVSYANPDALRPSAEGSDPGEITGDMAQKGNPGKGFTTNIPSLVTLGKPDLDGKVAIIRVDWNIPNLKSIGRIEASIPGILHVINNAGTVIVLTHYGRPDGKVVPEWSVKPLADILKQLLKEQNKEEIKVVFHEESVTEKGLKEGLKDEIVPGAINVLENVRFCKGEDKKDRSAAEAFARALAGLAGRRGGIFGLDGFGAGGSDHVSTVEVARYMEKIALGPLVIQEENAIRGALETLYGLIFGGGPKAEEKMPAIKNAIQNMKPEGFIIIGSGPAVAFLKAKGIEVGQEPSDEQVQQAREIQELATKKGIRLIMPIDFIAVDRNLDQKVPGSDKRWLDLHKIPNAETANFYHLVYAGTATQPLVYDLKTNTEVKDVDPKKLFIYDIGEKSIETFKTIISGVPKDNSIVWNGALGVNEMPEFAAGTKAVAEALAAVSKKGVNTVAAGGDTADATKQFGVDKELSYVSTGGGAALVLLAGKELVAVVELTKIQDEKIKAGI